MSPVSRGRRGGKSPRTGARILRSVPPPPADDCDCPVCSGDADIDPQQFIDDLVAGGAELLDVEDPLEAELFSAVFLAAGEMAGTDFTEALAGGIVPAIGAKRTREALAVLLGLAALEPRSAAKEAAAQLVASGVPAPPWAAALDEPAALGASVRFTDQDETGSMLVCTFHRGEHAHGFTVHVDHTDCHAAAGLMIFPAEALDDVAATIRKDARRNGVKIVTTELAPEELRWQVERALDARSVHDAEVGPSALAGGDEDMPSYHQLMPILRARMRVLPAPSRPPATHAGDAPAPRTRLTSVASRKSAGAAAIYQLKVTLLGAKPPIWRRLEVPADTSLAALHQIIQLAFDWDDSHMHVFETPYGDFGVPDRELGHESEIPVTLEQVAPGKGKKIRYTYDFGDDWAHDILVEKVLDRGPGEYPRCTGGRRAAPPEDCGGVWGYADLVAVLADPSHPDHEERLEWLGLESAADFDPAEFDAAEITRLLTR